MTGIGLDRITTYADGLDHPEGVAVAADGTVWAGGEAGQIYRIREGKPEQVASTGGFVLGLALDAGGVVYACDTARREVLVVEPGTGSINTLSGGAPGAPFRNPNFPAFDAAGNLYVTDSGGWKADDGDIKVIRPDGSTEVWSRDLPHFPNGCCLSSDGTALLVIESLGRPGVSRIPIEADGSAGRPERVCDLPGSVPDGLAVDEDGGLFVACYRPDRVYYVDAAGRVEIYAEDPEGTVLAAPTNVVFTGRDRRTLVIGSLGRWHLAAARVDVAGVPLHFPTR
jgi:gluconolactonase